MCSFHKFHILIKRICVEQKLKYLPILLFVSKTVTYFANRILFLSPTYFAQNSAGKNFQGLVQK